MILNTLRYLHQFVWKPAHVGRQRADDVIGIGEQVGVDEEVEQRLLGEASRNGRILGKILIAKEGVIWTFKLIW